MVTAQDVVAESNCYSLLSLNNDCLEHIFSNLNVVQQFLLFKLHSRFRDILRRMWRIGLKEFNLRPELLNTPYINDEALLELLAIVLSYVEKFTVCDIEMRRLRLLTDGSFCNVLSFECEAPKEHQRAIENDEEHSDDDDDDDEDDGNAAIDNIMAADAADVDIAARELNTLENHNIAAAESIDTAEYDNYFMDEDVLMLQRVFPNLKQLRLRNCVISGRYLSRLRALQQLGLDECRCLESEYFLEVFQCLSLRKFDIMDDCDELNCCDLIELKKCPTLEHIKIADYHLCFDSDIINDILRMPLMQKLSIYSRNFVFDVMERIAKNQIKTIKAFKFNGVLYNMGLFVNEICHMRQLHKLAFHGCRGQDIEGIRDHHLLQLARQLPELREVHLCDCTLESEQGLLHFVTHSRHLTLINITQTQQVSESFVWRCIELLRKQQQRWRTQPLELWLRDTPLHRESSFLENPRLMHNSRLLKIDVRSSIRDTNPPGVLKFTFA